MTTLRVVQQECEAIDYKQEDFRRIMDVNVLGVFNTAQAAARVMFAHGEGGSITAIGSMSGTVANRVGPWPRVMNGFLSCFLPGSPLCGIVRERRPKRNTPVEHIAAIRPKLLYYSFVGRSRLNGPPKVYG